MHAVLGLYMLAQQGDITVSRYSSVERVQAGPRLGG